MWRLKLILMRTYIVIRSKASQSYYIYNSLGCLVNHSTNLAEVSTFVSHIQRVYQYRHVVYSNTVEDDVIIATIK